MCLICLYQFLESNALRVECNITTGPYINNRKVYTIHEFFLTVPPGYKMVEVPAHVIYLPIAVKAIHNLQLRIVDQDGDEEKRKNNKSTFILFVDVIKKWTKY